MSSMMQAAAQRAVEGSEGKLSSAHLMREALVYVRQSTQHQVRNNQESAQVQYALKRRAEAMGFAAEQIQIIDEDQGHSGTSREGRSGFEKLFEKVRSGRVGMVMSLDVSRLCRSSLDWQGLVHLCAHSNTLLAEQEALYDPRSPNDRLSLGFKGAMSEFELELLRLRMEQGRKNKAMRGALALKAPRGYVLSGDGVLLKDPDQQVRSRIESVFRLFERFGSVRQVLRSLREQSLELPRRRGAGELEWKSASAISLRHILQNPIYTGAYVYGRRKNERRLGKNGQTYSGSRQLPREQWAVVLPEQHEAYISMEQFEANVLRQRHNSPKNLGAPRSGPSLLAGLLRCGLCGAQMVVSYSNNGAGLRYSCISGNLSYGTDRCQSLLGQPLEEAVEELVLQALEPAALELSMGALQKLEQEQRLLHQDWLERLERCRYNAELARRRYEKVDPDYRLAAQTLEREWNAALEAQQSLIEQYEVFCRKRPLELSTEQREDITALATDIPALWRAATTTPQQRQALVRLLIERVEVLVEGRTEKLQLRIHWAGGDTSTLNLRRSVAKVTQLSYYEAMLSEIHSLHLAGLSDAQISEQLPSLGFTGARGQALGSSAVGSLRRGST